MDANHILVDDVQVACTAFVGMHAVRGARPKGEGDASFLQSSWLVGGIDWQRHVIASEEYLLFLLLR